LGRRADLESRFQIPASSNAPPVPFWDSELVALSGVLVVDDNRSFADVARGLLERQGERVLGTACTSADAVELARELQPEVVLVDLALGDECGLDLARLLAGDGSGKAPVVILISACSPCDVAELIAASPAAGFLPKSDLSSDAIRSIVASCGRICGGSQSAG
jgi:DNA-binding NarL/FixJ family response regulator